MSDRLKIAVPNKGRLSDRAVDLLSDAGLHVPKHARRLLANVDERWQLLFVRTQDVPEYVATGTADVGITGRDLVQEAGLAVKELMPLGFGKCRMVVAVPKNAQHHGLTNLQNKRIATAFPRITRDFFRSKRVEIEIVPLSGATEIAPQVGVADAIVDLVETGSTLRQHGLVEVEAIMDSEAILIAGSECRVECRHLRIELEAALGSVLAAQQKRYLMLNLPLVKLAQVRELLPGITSPTVMNLLSREDWVAVHSVVNEKDINTLIPKLKEVGAQGILVLPIERMVS